MLPIPFLGVLCALAVPLPARLGESGVLGGSINRMNLDTAVEQPGNKETKLGIEVLR
jgi:hypothetical protein